MDNINTNILVDDHNSKKHKNIKLDASLLKILITILNIGMILVLGFIFKSDGDALGYYFSIWIPYLSILGLYIPNTTFKHITGSILCICGGLATLLSFTYIIMTFIYSWDSDWIAIIIAVSFAILISSILVLSTGIFILLYETTNVKMESLRNFKIDKNIL